MDSIREWSFAGSNSFRCRFDGITISEIGNSFTEPPWDVVEVEIVHWDIEVLCEDDLVGYAEGIFPSLEGYDDYARGRPD
jgi:hypothetical protein